MSRLCPAILALFAIAACSDSTAPVRSDSSPAAGPLASQSQEETGNFRALTGTCTSQVISVDFISPTMARQVVVGTCELSHIGHVAIYLRQVIDFTTLKAVSELETFTAPNGDVLRATSTTIGTPTSPTSFALTGDLVFIGGTGRFANASGSAAEIGSADFATGVALLTLRGQIALNGRGHGDDDHGDNGHGDDDR